MANARVQCLQAQGDSLWATCRDLGLLFSPDAGLTWERRSFSSNAQYFPAQLRTPEGHIFVGTTGTGLFRSLDDGQSWTQVVLGEVGLNVDALELAPDGSILMGIRDEGFFRSEDGGLTWGQHNSGLRERSIRDFAISPAGTVFASTIGGLFVSTDGGDHWDEAGAGLPSLSTGALFSDTADEVWVSVAGWGVWRSQDGGASWTAANSGQATSFLVGLVRDTDGALLAGGSGGVWRLASPESSWEVLANGMHGFNPSTLCRSGERVWAGLGLGGVYRGLASPGSCDAPVALHIERLGNQSHLSWDPVPGALGYAVYASTGSQGPWILSGQPDLPFFEETSSGQSRFYQVRTRCP
jgi:photosystem II stability/assembly factor-like uncharacterized protein